MLETHLVALGDLMSETHGSAAHRGYWITLVVYFRSSTLLT